MPSYIRLGLEIAKCLGVVILHTLDELSQTVQASGKQSYTKEELLDLLGRVANFMKKGGAGE